MRAAFIVPRTARRTASASTSSMR